MPQLITKEVLKKYIEDSSLRHKAYTQTVNIMKRLKVHADGEMPEELIKKRRPSEQPEVFKYRQDLYEAITEEVVSRIINCLSKIKRSRDWNLNFDNENIPAIVKSREDAIPEKYAKENFPYFGSIDNWLFDVCMRQYLIDPNALCCVIPLSINVKENDMLQPFPFIFNSNQVLDYVQDDYAIVQSTDCASYTDEKGNTYHDGKVWYTFDTQTIQRWSQKDLSGRISQDWKYFHKIGKLPCFKLGGMVHKALDTSYIYKSRINSIVPRLNDAAREYNDLQSEVVLHIHSEKVIFQSNECPQCDATGKMLIDGNEATCTKCNGDRYLGPKPYGVWVVTPPANPGAQQQQGLPVQYVQKQVEIVKIQDERVEKHLYKALAAINMQFLAEQGSANASGERRKVDQDELNTFVHSISEDLVAIDDKFFSIAWEMRYRVMVESADERKKLRPKINVPEKFDLLSSSYLIAEYKEAKDAGVSPLFLKSLQLELAGKTFSSNPAMKVELETVLELDPLFGLSHDDKLSMLQNKGIEQRDYTLSCNMAPFVKRAQREDKDFLTKSVDEKLKKLYSYADEKVTAMSAAGKIKSMIPVDGGGEAGDSLGKLPLALQQLTLAATRAEADGDAKLAKLIRDKAAAITSEIDTNNV